MTRVLVLEGEPALMRLLAWSLGEAGFDVTPSTLESLASGIAAAPDVIILNRRLSIEQRSLFFSELARHAPGVPVIDLEPAQPDLSQELTAAVHLEPPHRAAAIIDQIHRLVP